jgi:hypothetical protein
MVLLNRTGGGSLMAMPSPAGCAGSGIASSSEERLAGFASWVDGSCGACGSGQAGTADLLTKPTRPAVSPVRIGSQRSQ